MVGEQFGQLFCMLLYLYLLCHVNAAHVQVLVFHITSARTLFSPDCGITAPTDTARRMGIPIDGERLMQPGSSGGKRDVLRE